MIQCGGQINLVLQLVEVGNEKEVIGQVQIQISDTGRIAFAVARRVVAEKVSVFAVKKIKPPGVVVDAQHIGVGRVFFIHGGSQCFRKFPTVCIG